ncbi:MAG: hypothetical protein ACRENG_10625 [bacterium]
MVLRVHRNKCHTKSNNSGERKDQGNTTVLTGSEPATDQPHGWPTPAFINLIPRWPGSWWGRSTALIR